MHYNNQPRFLHQQVCHLRVVPMREVPHFSEHKSRAIGTQTPSHFLCQEKTHQDAYWKSVGPSGSFGCPSHKKKQISLILGLARLARSLAPPAH